jgi:hypothetical protein
MIVSARKLTLAALLTLAVGLAAPAFAQDNNPPDALDLSKVRLQVVDATFVANLQGTNATYKETQLDKYRGLILTVKVTKQPGVPLTVICQDINIHYRFGESSDVAKCFGLSTFSAQQDEDRAMSLYSLGWGKSSTGASTTKSGTVYFDVFFQNMEPETHDVHLFWGQSIGVEYTTHGWTKQ